MDKPLSPAARVILWFVAVDALICAVSLLPFPARTETLFFWGIIPPINAALFGALYLSGAWAGCCPSWAWRPFSSPRRSSPSGRGPRRR